MTNVQNKRHTRFTIDKTNATYCILYQAQEERGYFLINDQLQLACN
jgi:hypothetical protein